ncbi:MAG: HD-GYP domain-containing protein [Magnetococcales bacterium]|nr:HD-GYP domain-containing protein [Magnetococcales bacterium]
MIKKIPVTSLHPGMYVHDFNHSWKDPCCGGGNPRFPTQPRLIRTETEVREIIDHGIRELDIDTDKGEDVAGSRDRARVEEELAAQLLALGDDDDDDGTAESGPTFTQELNRAAEVKTRARQLVGNVLEDARMGKQVELGPMRSMVEEMAESMFRNQDAILSLSLIKKKDEYTFMHSVNVGVFMLSFCQALGITSQDLVDVGVGAVLHDIGKMKTPPGILNKPGKLTDEEFKIMKMHVTHSRRILERCPGISEVSMSVAYQHHERYDGSGYPEGLKGDKINTFGQMAAICDVYDAITSDRVYHKGNVPHTALKRMLEWSKYHFSAELYHKFVKCVGIYPIGSLVRLSNDHLAVVVCSNAESQYHPVVKVMANAKIKKKVEPIEINLMHHKDVSNGLSIVGCEEHTKWGIDPKKYMPNPKVFE